MKKAIILFSGGLDSTTVLAYVKNNNFQCFPITFNYGQRHSVELDSAKKIAEFFKVTQHKIINLPNDMFGSSALTQADIEVPEFSQDSMNIIPLTYVPARNTIFLSIALGYAESIGAQDIFLGISHVDYSNYPDCRPEFLEAFQKLANLATKEAVEGSPISLHAPLLHLSKAETIKLGIKNGVDYSMTISCYNADLHSGAACGKCDSCSYRKKGFLEASIADPTVYASLK
jgi:7-cyano-7-deazaguanine synthase